MARTFATARMDASARCVALAGCAFGCACVLVSLTTTRAMRGANARSSGDALIEMSRRSREALVSGAAVGLNLGNFAYPLAEILHGARALELIVVFDATNQVFLLIVAHAIYTWRCSKIDGGRRRRVDDEDSGIGATFDGEASEESVPVGVFHNGVLSRGVGRRRISAGD